MTSVVPVVLCGGAGTRLWPLSRKGFPKQFLCLAGTQTLFQQAVQRLMTLQGAQLEVQAPCVITSEEHRFLVSEQLREMGLNPFQAILEPQGKNTAPALTLAAMSALAQGGDPVLVVTPADQTIQQADVFTQVLRRAVGQAMEGQIVILGVPPDRPETGYGYIEAGTPHPEGHAIVSRFVEKPDVATAQRYVQQGNFFWNAGIFVLRASVWLRALGQFRPDILQATEVAWTQRQQDAAFVRPGSDAFAQIPAESVDYAVMERCPGSEFPIVMLPLKAGWSDLGSWDAVANAQRQDEQGNAIAGDVLALNARRNLIHSTSRLVCALDVDDLVIVETADAVLVARRESSQNVKDIVKHLDAQKRVESELHLKVHRPWGWYLGVDEGERFKVKRIQVNPKASLSLQMHHHRAEHWIVVRGTAEITNGDHTFTLQENESTFIPLGQRHRLANPGLIPLEIVEVQSGPYLGEDDIVRFEDHYGRKNA